MSLFTVYEEKCDLCLLCLAACPAGLVAVTGNGSVPSPVAGAEEVCFRCGHCVAVCPTGAFSHQYAPAEQCLPIRPDLRITGEQAGQLMRSRRSVRNFTDKPVARDTITELLDIARFAPSGCNSQPVHWLVIHNKTRVLQVAELVVGGLRQMIAEAPDAPLASVLGRLVKAWDEGINVITRGAPHLILAHAPKANPLAPSACIIAQTYLELAASAHGLGACWMGLVDMTANTWAPLREFLALPAEHVVLASMAIGHPEFEYVCIPPRERVRVVWR
jgi:nitroreductase/NAD-dependent dihydropyrimidine dehydrogenase PreA subunit